MPCVYCKGEMTDGIPFCDGRSLKKIIIDTHIMK